MMKLYSLVTLAARSTFSPHDWAVKQFLHQCSPHVYSGLGGVLALGLSIFMMKNRSKGSKVSKSVFGSL